MPAPVEAPTVTAVMPVLNDATHLPAAVSSLLKQHYPTPVELVMAIGPSTDGTEAVAVDLARQHPQVRVVDSPTGRTAASLNLAIQAATGDVIVRIDSHCELPAGYIERAVETLTRTGAANVGGIQAAEGDTPFEKAVALAMTSKFGVGNASFHYGGTEGPTDTVYLGVFDAAALRQVGLFDEHLVRNQDYELNWRLREAGHTVWLDPELRVRYRPRGSLRRLASQYFQYGQWKRVMLRKHPSSVRARQLAAPITVVGLAIGVAGGLVGKRWMLSAPAVYGAAVAAASVSAAPADPATAGRLLAVFPTMHLSWGVGFLKGPPAPDAP